MPGWVGVLPLPHLRDDDGHRPFVERKGWWYQVPQNCRSLALAPDSRLRAQDQTKRPWCQAPSVSGSTPVAQGSERQGRRCQAQVRVPIPIPMFQVQQTRSHARQKSQALSLRTQAGGEARTLFPQFQGPRFQGPRSTAQVQRRRIQSLDSWSQANCQHLMPILCGAGSSSLCHGPRFEAQKHRSPAQTPTHPQPGHKLQVSYSMAQVRGNIQPK